MVKNLKKLRKDNKVSQQKLADEIGVSQQSINKYENHNIEPDIDTLIKISNFFNTSVDYLIGNTEINLVIENVYEYDLNDEEKNLIENYRKLLPEQKNAIYLVIKNFNKK